MDCNNGTCGEVAGATCCCFECEMYEQCPDGIKCDDRAGYEAGTCLGRDDDD